VARLITSGFEVNGFANGGPDGGNSLGTESFVTSPVRTGARALKIQTAAQSGVVSWNAFTAVSLGNDCFLRAYINVPTGGVTDAEAEILEVGSFTVRMETNRTLTLWALVGGVWTQQGSASAAVALDTWTRVELRGRAATGSIDQCEARLEGSTFASASGLSVDDTPIAFVAVGLGNITGAAANVTGTIYFDDVAVNDSSGASQTSWPGSGKVVLLKPISDNAKGTGWTNDQAATTNLFASVSNTPPIGIADTTSGGGTHQLRNATSNANVNYDANLTTYTTAGIGASDTVNVLVPMVATAAPVATSAKAGTYGISANPAIANVSLGAGGTAGAFWSGVAAGTYPTGWKWSFGTTTYAPAVTLGSSPVARITQVTSSTRIADVCAMGMYVDYTPATTKAPPFQARTARNSLLRR
jgi:hypothetical protein